MVAMPATKTTLVMTRAHSTDAVMACAAEARRREYEAGHCDSCGAETPHEPSGDRGQRYRWEPGESHQQHVRLVESELDLQQRTESGIHGDEAQQHGAASRVRQSELAADRPVRRAPGTSDPSSRAGRGGQVLPEPWPERPWPRRTRVRPARTPSASRASAPPPVHRPARRCRPPGRRSRWHRFRPTAIAAGAPRPRTPALPRRSLQPTSPARFAEAPSWAVMTRRPARRWRSPGPPSRAPRSPCVRSDRTAARRPESPAHRRGCRP